MGRPVPAKTWASLIFFVTLVNEFLIQDFLYSSYSTIVSEDLLPAQSFGEQGDLC